MAMNVLVSMLLALTLAPQAPAAQTPASSSAPSTQTSAPAAQSPAPTTPGAPADAAKPATTPPGAAPQNYVIGPNDLLSIAVQDDENMGLTNKYRVDESGMVTIPYLGRVTAGGQTLLKFQQELTRQLANGYINSPQVRVDIGEYKSQIVYVTGAVRTPTAVEMQGTLTLMAALVKAGSPTSDAADEVQISHKQNPNDGPPSPDQLDANVRHVKLKDLNLGQGDIALLDGDIVFVPTAKHFTITGQVRNTGSYVWEDGLTVDKAIARAGGMNDRGSTRGITARRFVNGKMQDVDLNMQSLVLPDDVIKINQRIF